jgi:5,10-methylenetetrahydromethanopterin reductase
MKLGLALFPTEPVSVMRDLTHLAEVTGYSHVWIGDSQNIWRELGVTVSACAAGTQRIVLGSGVTNAVTRHLSVVASTWATLAEMTQDRVAIGIGAGYSSLGTLGLKQMRLAQMESVVAALRALLRGESATDPLDQQSYRLSYIERPLNVPIYIGAQGPRLLELAGRIADGVIAMVGTAPPLIQSALGHIDAGARQAGKSLTDLDVILWTPGAIARDSAVAKDRVRGRVARAAMKPLGADLAPELMAAIGRIREHAEHYEGDFYHHQVADPQHAELVPDSLVDSLALAGDPDECREHLSALSRLGINQVAIVPFDGGGHKRLETVRMFGGLTGDDPRISGVTAR